MGYTDSAYTLAALKRYGWTFILIPAAVVAVVVGFFVWTLVVGGFARMVAGSVNGFAVQAWAGDTALNMEDTTSMAAFDQLVSQQTRIGNLTYVRLTDAAGIVRYSTQPSDVGQRLPLEGDIAAALRDGATASRDLGPTGAPESASQREVLEITSPVLLTPNGEPAGVLVIGRPYATVKQGATRAVILVVSVVLLGSLVAYALLRLFVHRAELAVGRARNQAEQLNEQLQATLHDQEVQYVGTLQSLAAAVNAKDSYTAQHSLNVTAYCTAVAAFAHWSEEERTILERGGLVHDIGKIAVREELLLKPGRVSPAERRELQRHTIEGASIVETIPFMRPVVPMIRNHHERWDGTGYPDGLAGEEIPRTARLVAVADAFDAMTTDRPYRNALRLGTAINELRAGVGTQFDPGMIEQFLDAFSAGALPGFTRQTAQRALVPAAQESPGLAS